MSSGKPKGGKKIRRGKNVQQEDTKLITATEDQYYAKVTQLLGNSRVYLDVFIPKIDDIDAHVKQSQLGIIRGGIRKRTRLIPGSIVLVSLREFENNSNKVDILHAYNNEQVSKLKHKNLLPKSKIFENDGNEVQFENDNSDNEDFFIPQKSNTKESYTSNFNLIPDEALNLSDEDEDEDDINNI